VSPPAAPAHRSNGKRSILDLAPLELACMNALWPLGQATVRDISRELSGKYPRAYTTILTIMDRLARKGVVSRHKTGRAWLYRPALSAEAARDRALWQLVHHFFGGSKEALQSHLMSGRPLEPAPLPARPDPASQPAAERRRPPRAVARAASPDLAPMDDSLL
jgi:predicted transcriptional regulator